ncbi:hypothetical protein BU16DRAFT_74453 [Lophium mytilinum]|uniref:Uncharacterized protein n=1 Tax=Lophium mytilinum TaxID=390894 RepID=A0A6A6QQW1_9PEZI|nr:hypothetical protein BU16DRAFT_74453 [Lophium mytilinum]
MAVVLYAALPLQLHFSDINIAREAKTPRLISPTPRSGRRVLGTFYHPFFHKTPVRYPRKRWQRRTEKTSASAVRSRKCQLLVALIKFPLAELSPNVQYPIPPSLQPQRIPRNLVCCRKFYDVLCYPDPSEAKRNGTQNTPSAVRPAIAPKRVL